MRIQIECYIQNCIDTETGNTTDEHHSLKDEVEKGVIKETFNETILQDTNTLYGIQHDNGTETGSK